MRNFFVGEFSRFVPHPISELDLGQVTIVKVFSRIGGSQTFFDSTVKTGLGTFNWSLLTYKLNLYILFNLDVNLAFLTAAANHSWVVL